MVSLALNDPLDCLKILPCKFMWKSKKRLVLYEKTVRERANSKEISDAGYQEKVILSIKLR